MKKYFLSLTALFLLFLMLPTSLEAAVTDGESNKYHAVSVDGDKGEYDFHDTCTKDEFTGIVLNRKNRSSAGTSETGLFGSQLSGEVLEIYEGLSSVELGPVQNGVSTTISLSSGEDPQSVFDRYCNLYPAALYAYARDHHDMFYIWWSTNSIGMDGSYTSVQITLTFYYDVSPYYTDDLQNEADERIDDLVQACDGYNRETKLRYYHDWIVENNEYDTPTSQIREEDDPEAFYYAHTAVGCLLKGKGVCESYSKLLKVFCLRENIPCLLITSDSHAWNYVKMEDGNWYMVDCTWDDPLGGSGEIFYTYFLVSNEPNIDDAHTVDTSFIYPATSSEPYPSTHDFRLVERIEATCATEGSETYCCSICGESTTFTIPIDPSNHTGGTHILNAREATDKTEGYTGDIYCNGCNLLLRQGEIIPKKEPVPVPSTNTTITTGSNKPTSGLRLAAVSIVSLKNSSAKTIKVKWRKNAHATGYQLQYALNNKFTKKTKTLLVNKAGTLSRTVKKLKKGKKYYVRIRAYKIYGNATYYSPWSKTKKIKIKK